ncbi:hypothetical protein F5Y15DRAFT_416930 [Xylariaceae sp. FL0016]|nr:hypothetical protein F5Y15DRAFT_416930 [Xylariaceae sp. FL0016]
MATPYWGQLPPPKARRISEEYDQTNPSNSQPKPARDSVQTEATFTPLVSPATSNFNGAGLAPRPPSMPYAQSQPPDHFEKRRRRRSRRSDQDDLHQSPASPPPAAPDVPKAPPSSYRYGNSGSPYSFTPDGKPAPPISSRSPHARVASMDSDMFYKNSTPPAERLARAPVLDRHRHNFEETTPSKDAGRSGSMHRSSNGYSPVTNPDASFGRQESLSATDAQRKKWADDRSPLQRLELTLDSITKEEKRARVEAAERKARERAAGKAIDRDRLYPESPRGQSVRFRERRQPTDQDDERRVVTDPIAAQPSAAASGPLSQNPSPGTGRVGSMGQSPRSQIPVAKNRNVANAEKAELPQRSLSFRDRATATDRNAGKSTGQDPSDTGNMTTISGGPGISRSGSNKLKKNPPDDPWYALRNEAEEKSAAYQRRNVRSDTADVPLHDARMGNTKMRSISGGAVKQHGPPSQLEDFERPPSRGKQFQGYDRYDDFDEYEEPPSRMRGIAAAIGLGRSNSMGGTRQSAPQEAILEARTQGIDPDEYDDYNDSPNRNQGLAGAMGSGCNNSAGKQRHPQAQREAPQYLAPDGNAAKSVKFPDQKHEARVYDPDASDVGSHSRHFKEFFHRDNLGPGQGMYKPPIYLDEWKTGTVCTLSGSLMDISQKSEPSPDVDKSKPWWENGGRRRSSVSARPQKAEAFDGEYDDTQAPTRFKPQLYLKCGPLLRYCGIRHEKPLARTNRNSTSPEREIWRGSVMIVTQDSESSYEIVPILRLFVQPMELLPPPPAELRGEEALLPEYVDPIAGIPKLGRRGETLYVRPVEHLEEGRDASMLEPDDGLFEARRTTSDFNNGPDPPGSFTSRKRRTEVDGEKVGKYKDVRGVRLHTERGYTFWRFNIEVELRDKQQRIAYRINRGPATGFWVPARAQSMNIMFHSCNGFSLSVKSDDLSGPDPMWRDVLNNHQTRPFHVMIGGGDQIYNDAVMRETELFKEWLAIRNPLHKNNAPFTAEMQDEMENFYLERYMMWFSQGLFGLANSQIPMVNMYDDHDIIDGFGSYPHHFMKSPVFSGLGNVAFKYYMLFQHQSLPQETEQSEPSWCLGPAPGPYINEVSRSLFMSLGARVALLAVDCRTERTRDEILREDTWEKLKDRCYDEIVKGKTEHLLVLLGVPIAYPRLVWLENILTSRLMDPIKALGKTGMLGNFLNHFDGGVEVLDDLDDHWTAKNHKDERKWVIEDLQDLAADRSIRITVLSGDVHLAAVGQFYSNPKLKLPKHKDFRYMPNIISSAIVNTPPPDLMADVLNKRNKVHHFDPETEEDMIPIFTHGVDGKARNNKHLLPHRNWCSIREYVPGQTPPPTPPPEDFDYTSDVTPPGSRGGILRRFSLSKSRGPAVRPDVPRESADRSRPPVSGGFMRSLSRRASSSGPSSRSGSTKGKLVRTLSLGSRPRNPFRRNNTDRRPDDGGINGHWGTDSEEDMYDAPPPRRGPHPAFVGGDTLGLRGGAGGSSGEFEAGDDSYFTLRPRRAATQPFVSPTTYNTHANSNPNPAPQPGPSIDTRIANSQSKTRFPDEFTPSPGPTPGGKRFARDQEEWTPRPFHRTPTGLSVKKLRKKGAEHYGVDLEGGLDICLNVEVNAKDPAGITVPYRLLVPKLWYEYTGEDGDPEADAVASDPEELEQMPTAPVTQNTDKTQGRGSAQERLEAGSHGYPDEYSDPEYDDGVYEEDQIPMKESGGGIGGGLKRLFSGRGSQYRARRGGQDARKEEGW